ncbi:HPr family phosphocarrier protein [Desulfonatronum thioautotrophicum]|uniref:HPr family phosphocarrier protein n=1 Tax=Desulfonatronum thioautotrophicum TaxID=617001 RepID=UPI0009FD0500|nr:HPr family phosphocarrier protein [Desulfonatronum thioautotrophicum]
MIIKKVSIRNKYGLHARPAAALARTAQSYACAISLRYSEKTADAKSILDVLALSLATGSQVDVIASGVDADEAIREICKCFESDLEEEPARYSTLSGIYARHLPHQGEAQCR